MRLLPEFDALMCGYDPTARERFADPATCGGSGAGPTGWCCRRCWSTAGSPATGGPPARPGARPLEVVWFAGTRRPRRAELDAPVAALEAALGITVTDVTLTREQV